MRENQYQAYLIKKLRSMFETCFILKNDPELQQGIPDLIILFEDKWAMLEVKASVSSRVQPNQEYYVAMFDDMSFAAFIYPENEEEVLDALQHAFRPRRSARLPKR